MPSMCGSRGEIRGSGPPPPLKNHKNIWFFSNSGPDPLNNHKATEPTFNVGPSSARQRNAILMAFRWQADDCPLTVVSGSSRPLINLKKTTKKKLSKLDPSDKIFWIRACHRQSKCITYKCIMAFVIWLFFRNRCYKME